MPEIFARRKRLVEAAKFWRGEVEAAEAEAARLFWKRKRLAFCRFRNPAKNNPASFEES